MKVPVRLALLLLASASPATSQAVLAPVWEVTSPTPSGGLFQLALGPGDRSLIADRPARSLSAFDAAGRPLWSTAASQTSLSDLDAAWSSAGEVYVVRLETGASVYEVARYSAAGVLLGTGSYGDYCDQLSIAAHPEGGYVVAGVTSSLSYGGAPAPGWGGSSGFIARHAADGSELWARRFDGQGRRTWISDVAALPSGDIVGVGASFNPSLNDANRALFRVSGSGQGATTSLSPSVFGRYSTIAVAASGHSIVTALVLNAFGVGEGLIEVYSPTGALTTSIWVRGASLAWSNVYAATPGPNGGVDAWVFDASPTVLGQPPFSGVVRYSASGVKLSQRSAPHSEAHARAGQFGDVFVLAGGPVRLARFSGADLGAPVCAGTPNSTGAAASTRLVGSAVANQNALLLASSGLPPGQSVLFLVANGTAAVQNPGGSQGTLCLGGAIGRYNQPSQVAVTSAAGLAHLGVDLTALPRPTGPVTALAGQTWVFQAWYRDANPTPTSNFTSAVSVLLE